MTSAPGAGVEAPTIVVRNARKAYGSLLVLDGISVDVTQNARLALLGPSGCGKTTLLSIIAGLNELTEGIVTVGGQPHARERLSHCAVMPQRDLLLPWRSALDNAIIPLQNMGMRRRSARGKVEPMFQRAGLGGFTTKLPSQLSGGMRQRVSFLRTLVAEKDVLLLDEPFGALDSLTRSEMQSWLIGLLEETPRTLVLVTHDVEEALLIADRVLVFSPRPGRIVQDLYPVFPRKATRTETISTKEFVHYKARALEVLV